MSNSNLPALAEAQNALTRTIHSASKIILGKEHQIRLALACLLAHGHLLIEDLPGVGKTTLAQTLAALLGLKYSRIQFTSDMLPADIIGLSVFERQSEQFRFVPGAVFSQLLLADEINRATPRTQSALLEAMAERQITIEGETHLLPQPFFVIATQNPSDQVGVFALPESQLDRFLMRIELGYPSRAAERALLIQGARQAALPQLKAQLSPVMLSTLQQHAATIHAAPALLDYVQNLIDASRRNARFIHGLSPRAALALLAAARAWALINQRQIVLPEDVQAVLPAVACHRLQRSHNAGYAQMQDITSLIESTALD